MANDVTTTFFANSQAAEAAIARLEKKYADLENSIKQVSKRSREEQSKLGESFAQWAKGLGSIATGYLALPALIGSVVAAQSEMNRKADEAAIKYDELIRKLRIQGGLTEAGGKKAQTDIAQAAFKNAVDFETAEAASRQMISQGFDTKDATGGGLNRILETMRATNARPEDTVQIVSAYASLLAATGQDKTEDALRQMTLKIQRTFAKTPLEAADLQALAPKIQGVSSVLSPDEAIAQFAIMKEKTGKADTAASALKMVWEKLQTASATTEATAALKQLGLKPKDVDAVGETPAEVLDRLAQGAEALPAEQRPAAFKKLFGEEAMAPAIGLVRDRAKIPQYVADMSGQEAEDQFAEAVKIGTSGRAAALQRSKLQEQIADLSQDGGFEEYMRALDELQRREGYGGFRRTINQAPLRARAAFNDDYEDIVSQAVPASAVQRRAEEEGVTAIVGGSTYSRIAKDILKEQVESNRGESFDTSDLLAEQKRTNELLEQLNENARQRVRDKPRRNAEGGE